MIVEVDYSLTVMTAFVGFFEGTKAIVEGVTFGYGGIAPTHG
jgi:hypothetical protein